MKGVAGTIGATGVQALAGDLERAIRENAEPERVDSLRGALAEALVVVGARLRSAVTGGEEAPPTPVPAADSEALRVAVRRMEQLLADADAASIDYLRGEGAVVRALFPGDEASKFGELVDSYAFEEALEALRVGARRCSG